MKNTLYLLVFFLTILCSCSDDDETTNNSATSSGLSGQWQFTTTPLNNFIDTTTLKGKNGNDFNTTPSINDEIYLYQSGNNISGFTGPFVFRGSIGDSIRIEVFEPAEGEYGSDTTMIKSSEMTLAQNQFGNLEGTGKVILDLDSTGVRFDTYRISASKISNISTLDFNSLRLNSRSSWLDRICDLCFDAVSFLISKLTDDYFRPMGNCWLHKSNGGYYIFGHTAPGSIFPVWTQTVYFPYEWSFCKTRRYKFHFDYDGQVLALNVLEDLITAQEQWLEHLGFGSLAEALAKIEDFYNQYGNFAIIVGYSRETGDGGIYVNVENGNPNAHSHPLVQTIINKLNRYFNGTFIFSGRNITDEWHLRRSNFLVCNSPVLYCYLIGTINVNMH